MSPSMCYGTESLSVENVTAAHREQRGASKRVFSATGSGSNSLLTVGTRAMTRGAVAQTACRRALPARYRKYSSQACVRRRGRSCFSSR